MNKSLCIMFITTIASAHFVYNDQQIPDFKEAIHLFNKRDLIKELNLDEKTKQEFDESIYFKIISFLQKQLTSEKITQATGRQVPHVGHDQKRKVVYTGNETTPTHIVLTFSGKKDLQTTINALQKNRVSHNFIVDTNGSIYPITSANESIEDALNHRPFAVGVSGKVINGFYEERDMNSISISIAVVGTDDKPTNEEQDASLVKLVSWLKNKYQIEAYNVVDYGTIAFPYGRRKTQENLPWEKLAQQGLTIWPKPSSYLKKFNFKKDIIIIQVSAALRKLGYITPITDDADNIEFKKALTAFQKHYKCQDAIGTVTSESLGVIKDLILQIEAINHDFKKIWPSME